MKHAALSREDDVKTLLNGCDRVPNKLVCYITLNIGECLPTEHSCRMCRLVLGISSSLYLWRRGCSRTFDRPG